MAELDRPLSVISLRVVLGVLGVLLVVTALVAMTVSWAVVHRLVRTSPSGTTVIERVETVRGEDVLPGVAERAGAGVVGLRDTSGDVTVQGVVLTADGLTVAPLSNTLPRSPRVLAPAGREEGAQRVREYPEKGLLVLRVPGRYPAPRLAVDGRPRPGIEAVAVARGASVSGIAAYRVSLAGLGVGLSFGDGPPVGIALSGDLRPSLPAAVNGAPVFDPQGSLLGIALGDRDGVRRLLLASDIDEVLQDVLRNPGGERVRVLSGVRGAWAPRGSGEGEETAGASVFQVEAVTPGSPAALAGLHDGDRIAGLEGKPFPTSGPLWGRVLEAARNGKTLDLLVLRGSTEVVVHFIPRITAR